MKIKYYDEKHKSFFEEKIKDYNLDCYNKLLVYLLSITKDTRKHFDEIYEINSKEIELEVFEKGWQTGIGYTIIRLAFNLFNVFSKYIYEKNSENQFHSTKYYTPYYIFCHTEFAPFFYQAICIRFNIENGGVI